MNKIELNDQKLELSIHSDMVGIANKLEKISTQEKRDQIISSIIEYLHERFEPIDTEYKL